MKEILLDILNTKFKFKTFRPGQLETIHKLLEYGSVLCIQPTGYGKSLLYQLPAIYLNGLTIVICPLLALMRDQISQLQNRFDIAAGSINSDQSIFENDKNKLAALNGKLKILFISPEQLEKQTNLDFLSNCDIQLLVVDEAHCISSWGHDFRPSYRQIKNLIQIISVKNLNLKILALTATANKNTEYDKKSINHY